jgi:hypothetical protein
VRFWDGRGWTAQVATWSQPWTDPPGLAPGQVDASLLGEPSLRFVYGPVGIEGVGAWAIWDGAGQARGHVVVEEPGGRRPRRRYVLLNQVGQVVLSLEPEAAMIPLDAHVLDWTGRPHGLFDSGKLGRKVQFETGGQSWGHATVIDLGQSVGFGASVENAKTIQLHDGNGMAFAQLVNREASRGIGSWLGAKQDPNELAPDQSYFELLRPSGLPEPLRTFTLAFPALVAHRAHVQRSEERRSHRANRWT